MQNTVSGCKKKQTHINDYFWSISTPNTNKSKALIFPLIYLNVPRIIPQCTNPKSYIIVYQKKKTLCCALLRYRTSYILMFQNGSNLMQCSFGAHIICPAPPHISPWAHDIFSFLCTNTMASCRVRKHSWKCMKIQWKYSRKIQQEDTYTKTWLYKKVCHQRQLCPVWITGSSNKIENKFRCQKPGHNCLIFWI